MAIMTLTAQGDKQITGMDAATVGGHRTERHILTDQRGIQQAGGLQQLHHA
jgi:hypothetical protein